MGVKDRLIARLEDGGQDPHLLPVSRRHAGDDFLVYEVRVFDAPIGDDRPGRSAYWSYRSRANRRLM